MDREASPSGDTGNDTFESMIQEDSPARQHADRPPLDVSTPKSDQSSIKLKLSALTSPFRGTKGFRLSKKGKNIERADEDSDRDSKKSRAIEDDDTEVESEEGDRHKVKKKSGARSRAGALVRRLGSLGGRKQEARVADQLANSGSSDVTTPDADKRSLGLKGDGRASDPSFNDESGSRFGSAEDVDMQSPIAEVESKVLSDPESATAPATDPISVEDITSIATNHPVSTKPFAISTWKPKSSKPVEIERPIESPSPEDALRRRISFVKQATYCLSEDKEDLPDDDSPDEDSDLPATRLSRMVELARLQRRSKDHPSRSTSPSPTLDTTPSKVLNSSSTSQLIDVEKTDDEDYEDTQGVNLSKSDPMPPYGDLIVPEKKAAMGSGTSLTHPPGNPADNRREYLYKILVIGELGTGKTSIIKRYVHQFFSQHYRATIGVDFALKVLNWDPNTTIRLQLWDIAGQERFGNMTRVYYKEAVGAFIVFDVSRVSTFEAVVKWKQDLDSKVQLANGASIPCVLLGNKCDQQKEGLINNQAKMEEFCKERGFDTWFETSAKENVNIEEAARALVSKILSNETDGQSTSREQDLIMLAQGREDQGVTNKKKCTC